MELNSSQPSFGATPSHAACVVFFLLDFANNLVCVNFRLLPQLAAVPKTFFKLGHVNPLIEFFALNLVENFRAEEIIFVCIVVQSE